MNLTERMDAEIIIQMPERHPEHPNCPVCGGPMSTEWESMSDIRAIALAAEVERLTKAMPGEYLKGWQDRHALSDGGLKAEVERLKKERDEWKEWSQMPEDDDR